MVVNHSFLVDRESTDSLHLTPQQIAKQIQNCKPNNIGDMLGDRYYKTSYLEFRFINKQNSPSSQLLVFPASLVSDEKRQALMPILDKVARDVFILDDNNAPVGISETTVDLFENIQSSVQKILEQHKNKEDIRSNIKADINTNKSVLRILNSDNLSLKNKKILLQASRLSNAFSLELFNNDLEVDSNFYKSLFTDNSNVMNFTEDFTTEDNYLSQELHLDTHELDSLYNFSFYLSKTNANSNDIVLDYKNVEHQRILEDCLMNLYLDENVSLEVALVNAFANQAINNIKQTKQVSQDNEILDSKEQSASLDKIQKSSKTVKTKHSANTKANSQTSKDSKTAKPSNLVNEKVKKRTSKNKS